MKPTALAIDIGGTKIAAAAFSPDGSLKLGRSTPTPSLGPQPLLAEVVRLCREILAECDEREMQVQAVGVGTAGHVDHARGRIAYASGTLPGWGGVELRRELEQALKLPVSVENDVNALALGEACYGAGRGFADVLYVAVGTGVGGALICGGALRRGATHTAGELGHLVVDWDGRRPCSCGLTGHLEGYVAGPAIAARYSELARLELPPGLRGVAERARQGDRLAQQAIAEGGRILGLALGGLLNVFDPQALVIGGGVVELGDLWWPNLAAALRANAMPGPAALAPRAAQLGVDAVLVGAGWLALSELAPHVFDKGGS